MKILKRDIAWFAVVICILIGWFWLWSEFQRVLTQTVREINGEMLAARADKEDLEKQLQAVTAENERLKAQLAKQ